MFLAVDININSYALSGHPAIRMIETVNYGEPDYPIKDTKSMRLFTSLDNKLYMILYNATPSDKFPNFLQQTQAIIDSFQIKSRQLE